MIGLRELLVLISGNLEKCAERPVGMGGGWWAGRGVEAGGDGAPRGRSVGGSERQSVGWLRQRGEVSQWRSRRLAGGLGLLLDGRPKVGG